MSKKIYLVFIVLLVSGICSYAQIESWQSYKLDSFDVSISFPAEPFKSDEPILLDHTRKEIQKAIDPKTNTTYSLMVVHHNGMYQEEVVETFYKNLIATLPIDIQNNYIKKDIKDWRGQKILQSIYKDEEGDFRVSRIIKVGGNLYIPYIENASGDFDKATIDAFFESIDIRDNGEPEMYRFSDKVAGIACELPVRPTFRRQIFETDEYDFTREVIVKSHYSSDKYRGFNYLVMYRDNPAGIIFLGVDTTFNSFLKTYEQQFYSKAKNVRRILLQGFPTLVFDMELRGSNIRMAITLRGNRAYILMVEEITKGSGLQDRMEALFESVEFLPLSMMPLETNKLKPNHQLGFPQTEVSSDTVADYIYPYVETCSYYSLDTLSGIGYSYDEYRLSAFYTTENYDSLLQAHRDTVMNLENVDSVRDTIFQGGNAWYIKRSIPETDIRTFELMFYRGPYIHDILVTANTSVSDTVAWNYFNSFELNIPEYTDRYITDNKRDSMWVALIEGDSIIQEEARYTLEYEKMQANYLSNIYDLLEQKFPGDTTIYPSIHTLMLDQLSHFNKPEVFDFLEKLYLKNGADSTFQKQVLQSLLNFRSKEGLKLFFKYAKDFDPENTGEYFSWTGFYNLNDTLELAKGFNENWIELLKHNSLRYYSLELLLNQYKDTLIGLEDLKGAVPILIDEANRIVVDYEMMTKDSLGFSGELYDLNMINELLGYFPEQEGVKAYFKKQQEFKDLDYVLKGIKASYKAKIPIDSVLIDSIFEKHGDYWYLILEDAQENDYLDRLPQDKVNQNIAVEYYFKNYFTYSEYYMDRYQLLNKRGVVKGDKKYQLFIVKFYSSELEAIQMAVCLQPEDGSIDTSPDYFDYSTWNQQKYDDKEMMKKMLEDFDKWNPEE